MVFSLFVPSRRRLKCSRGAKQGEKIAAVHSVIGVG
jgi:hypothetical protein